MVPYIVSENRVTVFINGRPVVVECKNQRAYDIFLEKIQAPGVTNEDVELYFDDYKRMVVMGQNRIRIDNGVVIYTTDDLEDIVLPGPVADRYSEMTKKGYDIEPFKLFIENVQANPEKAIREELFLFLQAGNLPLTEDGCFLAYKSVKSDYTDNHSGTIDNHVGAIVEMEWEDVDKDRHRTCSSGLHFATYDYAHNWSSRLMVLKINPKDVAAIPDDYANQKGRCVRYEVVDEIKDIKNEKITRNFVAEGEDIKVDERTPEAAAPISNDYKSAQGYLKGDQSSMPKVSWVSAGWEYEGYLLCENPGGNDWEKDFRDIKDLNVEVDSLFANFSVKKGIKPFRNTTKADRRLVVATKRGNEVLSKVVLLLPLKKSFL